MPDGKFDNLNVSGASALKNGVTIGEDIKSGGKITLYSPDGAAWLHLDNGGKGELRISHGNKPGDHSFMRISTDSNLKLGEDIKSGGKITLYSPDGGAWLHLDNAGKGELRISHGNKPGDHEILSISADSKLKIGNVLIDGAAGDIQLMNADCAENFCASETAVYEPGTVMVINEFGTLEQSKKPYDRRVAGVVSGAGNLKPGLLLGKVPGKTNSIPIALIGKVYCKVDATHDTIQIGDLLTSSHMPGHAMRASKQSQAFGAVIGKALQPCLSGQELIPILVALQ